MDFSGTNRGYCYIRYETEDEAKRAVNQLNKYEIAPGNYLFVKMGKLVSAKFLFLLIQHFQVSECMSKHLLIIVDFILWFQTQARKVVKKFLNK